MADGRHFENSFIAICQPKIFRFKWNLVCRCRLCFQSRLLNKMLKFCRFKMADGRHIENRLLAISQRVIIGTRNLYHKAEWRSNTVYMTKIPNFENSRWRSAAIWKWFYRYNSAGIIRFQRNLNSVQPQVTLPRTVTWQSATILQIQHGRRTP